MMKTLVASLFLAATALPFAATAAPMPSNADNSSIQLAQYHGRSGYDWDRGGRRGMHRGDWGRHHGPRGWHRYGHRPHGWRSRGCIAVGPAWFCP